MRQGRVLEIRYAVPGKILHEKLKLKEENFCDTGAKRTDANPSQKSICTPRNKSWTKLAVPIFVTFPPGRRRGGWLERAMLECACKRTGMPSEEKALPYWRNAPLA